MAKAIVSTGRPKANETPRSPIPTSGKAAASTAEPQPPKVSQNVPIASATYFLVWSMVLGSCSWVLLKGCTTKSLHKSSASGRLSQVEPSAKKKQERSRRACRKACEPAEKGRIGSIFGLGYPRVVPMEKCIGLSTE